MFIDSDLQERVDLFKDMARDNMAEALGIKFTSLKKKKVTGTMPVHSPTKQPFGILHGGASVAFAETLASVGGWLILDDVEHYAAVGLEINANHIRSVSEGIVQGTATAIHAGRTTQVWDIRIHDEQERLVCVCRCTIAVVRIDRRPETEDGDSFT